MFQTRETHDLKRGADRRAGGGIWQRLSWRPTLAALAFLAVTSAAPAQINPGALPTPAPQPTFTPAQIQPGQPPAFTTPPTMPTVPIYQQQNPFNALPGAPGVQQVQAVGEPPLGKNPDKVPGLENLPPPRPNPNSPFTSNPFGTSIRTPMLASDGTQLLGATPVPDLKTVEEFKKFVERFIDPENTLDLIRSRARLIILKTTPKRIQLADESIAAYNLVSPKEITIIGRTVGATVMNFWFVDENGKEKVLSYLIRVFPDPEERLRLERVYKALEDELNRTFPNSVVHLRLVGDKIVLTGSAYDAVEAVQIVRLVRANSPNAGVTPTIPVDSLRPSINPNDPEKATPGLDQYGLYSKAEIVNMMRVPGEQQVMLKVTVAEVNRTAARSIGLNFTLTNNQGIQYLANLTGAVAAGANIPVLLDNGQISLAINALKTLNYARSLAEPNLVTLNGQPANFQAGGQFPVPIVTGATAVGLQGTSFVPYGVQLNFTPYVTDKDRIRLAVNANVSTRDPSATANIGGTSVPGLTTRQFATTVQLREGQTMAVAGLIQNNLGADRTNLPFIGDVPFVNRFTGLDKTSHGEQELVILVTPELVHPMEPKEVPPLPGSDIFEPSDIEFYILGRLESRRNYDYRSPVMNDLARQCRYRHCEQLYIFGPTGHSSGDAGAGPGHE